MRRGGMRVYEAEYDVIEAAQQPSVDGGKDIILWKYNEDDYKNNFSTQKTWDQIRIKATEIYRVVGF